MHRKFSTWCPEVQLATQHSSKLGQVAQAFCNQNLKVKSNLEAGDLPASVGIPLQGSGTVTVIFLFLTTRRSFPCYTSWLLPLAVFPLICLRSLASLYSPNRGLKITIQFPLAFSSPGGTKSDLSTSLCMPETQLITPAACTPVRFGAGLLSLLVTTSPSGWEHYAYTISHGEVQDGTQITAALLWPVLTYCLHSGTLLSLLQSQWQSLRLYLVRAE